MKNVPNLRFKEFSDEWNQVVLGDFLIKSSAITTENSDIPVATSSRKGLFLQTEYFNKEIAAKDTTGYNIVKKGYFTYRHMSDDSKFFFNINNKWDEILVSPEYPVFTTNQNLDSYFLQLHLNDSKSFSKFCKIQKKGGTRTRLYYSVLEGYKLLLPNIHEQEKISSFFSLIDKKIELQTEKVEELKNYKKGIMQKIFSQELRFKDENGNEYPEWEESKLGQICEIKKGEQLNKEYLLPDGKYYALNGGVEPSGFTDKYNTEQGVISISEGGNSCGYVKYNTEKFWSGGHCYTLENILDFMDSKYLFQFLKYNEAKIMSLRVGSGLPNIQKSALSNFIIKIPDYREQLQIANLLYLIDMKMIKEEETLKLLNQYKKGLLQQMFV